MINWGLVPAGAVLPFPFASFLGTGESGTISGLAVTDIEVYKGVSMTQRNSDAGYALMDTDGIDIDSRTGIQGFSIDTGENTDAGFYAAGGFFWVVVDAITVDGVTVRLIVGTFRLGAAESVAGVPKVDVSHVAGTSQTARDIGATLGAAGAGLTAVAWNAAWDTEVQSEVTDALNVTLSDSIPADGTAPSAAQALYMLTQFMLEREVSGTTVTVNKPDGTTALFTLTLDDGTTPTAITRAT